MHNYFIKYLLQIGVLMNLQTDLYRRNIDEFNRIAREHTLTHAKPSDAVALSVAAAVSSNGTVASVVGATGVVSNIIAKSTEAVDISGSSSEYSDSDSGSDSGSDSEEDVPRVVKRGVETIAGGEDTNSSSNSSAHNHEDPNNKRLRTG
jgi:hypothetical protein